MIITLISQLFVVALFVDAAYVAYGLLQSRNMWKFICVYWILLTCKNLTDFIGTLL